MASRPDPLGKRALYWLPVDEPDPPSPRRPWPLSRAGRAGRGRGEDGDRATGKRALYSTSPRGTTGNASRRGEDSANAARASVCDAPAADTRPGNGLFAVHCSSCRAVTAVGLLELVALHTPVGAFIPLRRFDHWMRCPACHRRTWAGVSLGQ